MPPWSQDSEDSTGSDWTARQDPEFSLLFPQTVLSLPVKTRGLDLMVSSVL